MSQETVVVLVRSGTSPRRAGEILRWLRRLLPTALLVTAPAAPPLAAAADVLTIDADAVESPLSLAEALARASRAAHGAGDASPRSADGPAMILPRASRAPGPCASSSSRTIGCSAPASSRASTGRGTPSTG